MATWTNTWLPDMGCSLQKAPSVRKVQFGDGYEQRIKDGLNNAPETWNLTFSRNNAFIDSIIAFLDAREGYQAFWWTTPKGKSIAVVAEGWDMSINSIDWQTASVTFRQVFEKPAV